MEGSADFLNAKCRDESISIDAGGNFVGSSRVKTHVDRPILDSSLPYIPVYAHLITHDLAPIERPVTPPVVKMLRAENRIDTPVRKTPDSKSSSRMGKRYPQMQK